MARGRKGAPITTPSGQPDLQPRALGNPPARRVGGTLSLDLIHPAQVSGPSHQLFAGRWRDEAPGRARGRSTCGRLRDSNASLLVSFSRPYPFAKCFGFPELDPENETGG